MACCAFRAVSAVAGRRDRRGRLPLVDLARERRPGERGDRRPGEHLGEHLRHPLVRVRLQSLRRADHDRAGRQVRRRARHHAAHHVRRHGGDHQRRALERGAEVGGGLERGLERRVRQEQVVAMAAVDLLRHLGLVGPERHRLAAVAQQVGERRAPAPRADDRRARHGAPCPCWPNRASVPAISRRRFERWLKITNSATASAAQSPSGRLG